MINEQQPKQRVKIAIHGAVQGVGFRPFVYRLASELELFGWVNNTPAGVFIEAEGSSEPLRQFVVRLNSEMPPSAHIQSMEATYVDPIGFDKFEILSSVASGPKTAVILPDLAVCPDCVREMFDPNNRRFRYPFINCTNCGPRYSIIHDLPYDRPSTTMAGFIQCRSCEYEYSDPKDRRFHAQPNACPVCGPRIELWNADGWTLNCGHASLQDAASAVRSGKIVAIKGLGGFQLVADARNEDAIRELRRRKHRDEKPFAVMYPDAKSASEDCKISPLEGRLLASPQAPIVLLERIQQGSIADAVAPDNPTLGLMLPYTPLHYLLMEELGFPIVATSGNLSDEPICIDEQEALERLQGIADIFLIHNRPIARHVDDSIVREVMGRELVLRRARGYAPLPVHLPESIVQAGSPTVIAYGAHQKCTAAITVGAQIVLSQHLGDLETASAVRALERVTADLPRLYDIHPNSTEHNCIAACDVHPDYASTRMAEKSGLPLVRVQHHYAHVLSCMAENELTGPVLGVAWDGTGFGTDRTIWGGEFLLVDDQGFERAGHIRPFLLPGADQAVRQPRRSALALLYGAYGDCAFVMKELQPIASFSVTELAVLGVMLSTRLNTPVTTSAGRLFDAAASLIGLRQRAAYEGQAGMLLEYMASRCVTENAYDISITGGQSIAEPKGEVNKSAPSEESAERPPYELDWRATIEQMVDDIRAGKPIARIAAMFQNALVNGIVQMATNVGVERVALTGGCFQNKYLTEHTIRSLLLAGFRPYWHQRIPPNDGGIALGQASAAIRSQRCA